MRVEGEMARSLLGGRLDLGRIVGLEHPGRLVEAELEDGIGRVGVRHKGEAVGAVGLDAVGVAVGVEGLDRPVGERPVVVDAVDCDRAAAVVGRQQVGDGVVGGQVGRAFFLRDLADRGELSAAAIDGVAGENAGRAQRDP